MERKERKGITMKYLLVFKNGYKMILLIDDGNKFIATLLSGSRTNPEIKEQICVDEKTGIMIKVSELIAVHPVEINGQQVSATD